MALSNVFLFDENSEYQGKLQNQISLEIPQKPVFSIPCYFFIRKLKCRKREFLVQHFFSHFKQVNLPAMIGIVCNYNDGFQLYDV